MLDNGMKPNAAESELCGRGMMLRKNSKNVSKQANMQMLKSIAQSPGWLLLYVNFMKEGELL